MIYNKVVQELAMCTHVHRRIVALGRLTLMYSAVPTNLIAAVHIYTETTESLP